MFTPKQRQLILKVFLSLFLSAPFILNGQIHHVVLDAGHGGKDPGAVAFNTQEKDVALSVTLKVGKLIEKHLSSVEVSYSRETDKFVELFQRAKIANSREADFFISIHANAASNASARGTETFVLGLHRNDANLEVVRRENAVISLEGGYEQEYVDITSPEAQILLELHQQNYLDQSIQFASLVESRFINHAGLKSRGVKQAGFLVLYKTSMPSVLIELGFLTHREECVFLASETGQNILAESIFFAFRDFVEKNASNNNGHAIEHNTTDRNEEVDNTSSVHSGIAYKAQLFATGKELPSDHAIYSVFNSITIETVGVLSRILTESTSSKAEALQWIRQAKAAGYEDAYLVTYLNGIRQ
ncbi:MAG TPA: N-acetylmuramoyl-L-alanine amidase [Bacteroidetes bacterium]|nr:N-acetylmuramoyl-L-alanine amidase [Bacteroidota bacterium]